MFAIARHIDGCSLNPFEYVLNHDDGMVLTFNKTKHAMNFLIENEEDDCIGDSIHIIAIMVETDTGSYKCTECGVETTPIKDAEPFACFHCFGSYNGKEDSE